MLEYLMKKIPVWVTVVCVMATFSFTYWVTPKPPRTLIPIQISGVDRITDKQMTLEKIVDPLEFQKESFEYHKFVKRFLYLQMLEYKNIFRIFYGTLTDEENKEFDRVQKKLED